MKKLTQKELDEIRLLDLEIRATKAEHQVEVKKLEVLELRAKLFANEVAMQRTRAEHLNNVLSDGLQKRRDFLKLVTKRKKLKAGWGFDPDSGEITED